MNKPLTWVRQVRLMTNIDKVITFDNPYFRTYTLPGPKSLMYQTCARHGWTLRQWYARQERNQAEMYSRLSHDPINGEKYCRWAMYEARRRNMAAKLITAGAPA